MDNKYLFLDSEKANNNIFSLDNRITGHYRLVSFSYTNNIFNITDNNNKVYWNDNGTNRVAILTNGYYDSNDFTSHLSTTLNDDASGTVSVALDTNTRKITVTSTLNFYFTFGSNTDNSARKLLGFSEADGSNATTQTSTTPIDLNTCKSVFIKFEQDDNRSIEGIDFFETSLMLSGNADFGEAFRYIDIDNFCQYVKFRDIKKIKVSFHDTSNNSINLNSEYQIILKKI